MLMTVTSKRLVRSATLFLLAFFVATGPAWAGDLVVVVSNVGSAAGEVLCALHVNAAGFPTAAAAVATRAVKAGPQGVTCHFAGLRAGAYAVAVVHDLNGNRKVDTNLLGLPVEDWGVSNNVRPRLRSPSFAEAQVQVGETGSTSIGVTLGR